MKALGLIAIVLMTIVAISGCVETPVDETVIEISKSDFTFYGYEYLQLPAYFCTGQDGVKTSTRLDLRISTDVVTSFVGAPVSNCDVRNTEGRDLHGGSITCGDCGEAVQLYGVNTMVEEDTEIVICCYYDYILSGEQYQTNTICLDTVTVPKPDCSNFEQ